MSIAGVSDSEWADYEASSKPNPLPGVSVVLLLQSGAIEGPFRVTQPVTVSTWQRIKRAVRNWSLK
jgi:hypothetical protein